ncbi:MAG: hypothetical protein IKH51_08505, partial [Clostridia bacterium]|nr:hypothetical protein [Clostridia bacterium]
EPEPEKPAETPEEPEAKDIPADDIPVNEGTDSYTDYSVDEAPAQESEPEPEFTAPDDDDDDFTGKIVIINDDDETGEKR